jgi:two-component sensor histidine kinase/CHASE3 domain sensor protein
MSISGRSVVGSAVALLAAGLAALMVIIGSTLWLSEQVQIHFNDVVAARDIRAAAVELRNALQTAESSQRGLLLSGNEIYLAPYDRAKATALSQLQIIQDALERQPENTLLRERLSRVVRNKLADMETSISLKNDQRDEEALALFRTNRGKALMDEANVFVSGLVRAADARLTASARNQAANVSRLYWISLVGTGVIILVVAGVMLLLVRYTRDIKGARDEVQQLNASLEARVQQRTAELALARDRAEALLSEVNHRVANSLAMVASFATLQSRVLTDEAAKDALRETQARIHAVASVHKRLYTSGNVQTVAVDEYMAGILEDLRGVMNKEGLRASLVYDLDPVTLRTDASINLAVIATEWVTNAFKYAYPNSEGQIHVQLRKLPEQLGELVVKDHGVGRGSKQGVRGTGLGTRIVRAMADSIRGEVQYLEVGPGTTARLTFPLQA